MFTIISFELETTRKKEKNYKEIIIDPKNIKTLGFYIEDSKKQEMINIGIKETLKFIISEISLKWIIKQI